MIPQIDRRQTFKAFAWTVWTRHRKPFIQLGSFFGLFYVLQAYCIPLSYYNQIKLPLLMCYGFGIFFAVTDWTGFSTLGSLVSAPFSSAFSGSVRVLPIRSADYVVIPVGLSSLTCFLLWLPIVLINLGDPKILGLIADLLCCQVTYGVISTKFWIAGFHNVVLQFKLFWFHFLNFGLLIFQIYAYGTQQYSVSNAIWIPILFIGGIYSYNAQFLVRGEELNFTTNSNRGRRKDLPDVEPSKALKSPIESFRWLIFRKQTLWIALIHSMVILFFGIFVLTLFALTNPNLEVGPLEMALHDAGLSPFSAISVVFLSVFGFTVLAGGDGSVTRFKRTNDKGERDHSQFFADRSILYRPISSATMVCTRLNLGIRLASIRSGICLVAFCLMPSVVMKRLGLDINPVVV